MQQHNLFEPDYTLPEGTPYYKHTTDAIYLAVSGVPFYALINKENSIEAFSDTKGSITNPPSNIKNLFTKLHKTLPTPKEFMKKQLQEAAKSYA